ncbi:ankyrin repeat domain-containing protein [Bacteroides sp. 519]|uniref:ankyrin repeat domain-containing protein n=1 Tax=Bacteroides sp. 519 TaxID=2302937 RepID=UPI0013D55D76|nr:ankyrin repeat domain-containing protein [Bacteroides sp. 519]NDV60161.1 hypothetical protein [Bacteroides sp. 519]
MTNIDEQLKNAIINNDIRFLEINESKYDIDHRFIDEDNDTLLLYALSYPGNDIYTFFLTKGANVNLVNNEGEGAIHSIVYSGKSERLRDLIKKKPQILDSINLQTNNGTSPLLLSVLLELYDVFHVLLEMGSNINLSDNEGNTPIHPACFLGYEPMVRKLVERGANLHVKTHKGNYPLALAINGDHEEIAKYLFKRTYQRI